MLSIPAEFLPAYVKAPALPGHIPALLLSFRLRKSLPARSNLSQPAAVCGNCPRQTAAPSGSQSLVQSPESQRAPASSASPLLPALPGRPHRAAFRQPLYLLPCRAADRDFPPSTAEKTERAGATDFHLSYVSYVFVLLSVPCHSSNFSHSVITSCHSPCFSPPSESAPARASHSLPAHPL